MGKKEKQSDILAVILFDWFSTKDNNNNLKK